MMYDYEVWNVSVSYKTEFDEEKNKIKVPEFTKVKLKNYTRVEEKHAEELNSQSENSLTRLYKKEDSKPKSKNNA